MTSMVDKECRGSNQLPSSMSIQEKASRNKRKFHADPPLGDPNKAISSFQNECPPYELPSEKFDIMSSHGPSSGCDMCGVGLDHSETLNFDIGSPRIAGPSEAGPSQIRDEIDVDEFHDANWSDLTESQLEELVLSNLDAIFNSAIKKIVACGYAEEVVANAILRPGLYYGCKDIVSNIVDNTLAYLKNDQGIDSPREHYFEDLQQLEKYILAELVCVLRQVRPFFSTGDAMWRLMLCDMNLSLACAIESDPSDSFVGDGFSNSKSSVPTNLQLEVEAKSSEFNLLDPRKSTPPTHCVYGSQLQTPSTAGCSNQTKQKNSFLNGQAVDEGNSRSACVNADKSFKPASHEEKSSGNRKFHSSGGIKRESALRQKSFHLEKNYRTYGSNRGRSGKFSGPGSLMLDKKMKSVSDTTGIPLKSMSDARGMSLKSVSESTDITMKSASLSINRAITVAVSQDSVNHNFSSNAELPSPGAFNLESVNSIPTLPKVNVPSASPSVNCLPALPAPALWTSGTDLSLSLPTKGSSAPVPVSHSVETANCSYAGIPYDKLLGRWFTQDQKDKSILMMVPRVCELQNELQEWTQWANEKVMQATRRLSKDNAELKTLRQEKDEVERLKKEKRSLEESTMKKLSEMENALCKASLQVDGANFAVRRLEMENASLRQEMEASKTRAAESAASCQEVLKREKKTMTKIHSWEKQKTFFQEELSVEKHKLTQLQQEVLQAKEHQNQLEAQWRQEEKARLELVTRASSLKKEREQIEASATSKETATKSKAEKSLQRYRDEIQKLEKEVSRLRLKTDSSKIAALRRAIDGSSYASRLTNAANALHQKVSDLAMMCGNNGGGGGVKRERECVMCLSEEMSVVFLPCAHQVVCTKCNELHEKQGMKDCPSCRSTIERRISVRYASSSSSS